MTRTRTSCPARPAARATFTITGVAGHGVDANIFTVITASYTDKGNGPAAPVTGRDEAILQPKLKQAEYFATTGRTADGRGTGDPGVVNEATTDVGGGNSAAFIEDGDWISFNPYNLEDLSQGHVPRGLGRRGRHHPAALRLGRRPARGRDAEHRADRRLADVARRHDQPAGERSRRARTGCSSSSVTRPPPAR